MMAAGLIANAFPREPSSPPVFQEKYNRGYSRRRGKVGNPGIEQVSTLTAPPVLPVLSG
jgi:hypothetical protein